MREIFLPGTHDSAAYAKHHDPQIELIVDKYTITQVSNETIQFNFNFVQLRINNSNFVNFRNCVRNCT